MQHAAFFDMDNTIVCTKFNVDGKYQIGFTPEGWKHFCGSHPRDAYKDCAPIEATIQYAKKLRSLGWSTHILTVTLSEAEQTSKLEWLRQYDPEKKIFNNIYFADKDEEKISTIQNFAKKNGISSSDCLLVEDNFYTLLAASAEGIQILHMAHILTGNHDILDCTAGLNFRRWYALNKEYITQRLVAITVLDPNCGGYCIFRDIVMTYEYAINLFGELHMDSLGVSRDVKSNEMLNVTLRLI